MNLEPAEEVLLLGEEEKKMGSDRKYYRCRCKNSVYQLLDVQGMISTAGHGQGRPGSQGNQGMSGQEEEKAAPNGKEGLPSSIQGSTVDLQ